MITVSFDETRMEALLELEDLLDTLFDNIGREPLVDNFIATSAEDFRNHYDTGMDVAGPQPFAEAMEAAGFKLVADDGDVAIFIGSGDEDHPLDAEVRAHVEGDLNGDGVVDEKDEAIRLAQLADDGNPHVGE